MGSVEQPVKWFPWILDCCTRSDKLELATVFPVFRSESRRYNLCLGKEMSLDYSCHTTILIVAMCILMTWGARRTCTYQELGEQREIQTYLPEMRSTSHGGAATFPDEFTMWSTSKRLTLNLDDALNLQHAILIFAIQWLCKQLLSTSTNT